MFTRTKAALSGVELSILSLPFLLLKSSFVSLQRGRPEGGNSERFAFQQVAAATQGPSGVKMQCGPSLVYPVPPVFAPFL